MQFHMSKIDVVRDFSPHQIELEVALRERSAEAADMYVGAIQVTKCAWNPDRIALSCHGIRELINSLPRHIDVPVVSESNQQLTNFTEALAVAWRAMEKSGKWTTERRWRGEIDSNIKNILKKAEAVVKARIEIRENKDAQFKAMIKKQNYSPVPLPGSIEKNKAQEWNDYRDYFVQRAHRKETTEEEFSSYLTHFEYLLLGYLKPRTFDLHEKIRSAIAEAERDQ